MLDVTTCDAPRDEGRVRTVLGDIRPSALGATDYHEHLFQISPLLRGEELDDDAMSGEEAMSLRESGFAAMINATPIGLERRPDAQARISKDRSLHVIAATGVHKEEHYGDGHWLLGRTDEQLAELFVADIAHGMPTSDDAPSLLSPTRSTVRAGIIKIGIGYWRISPFEQRAVAAAGAAHSVTNAPVMVHLDHGSAGTEILALLEQHGVPPSAVVLSHVDRNPDPYLHADLAAQGAYLGYDGFARHKEWPDSMLVDCLLAAAAAGAEKRILLGGDVARRSRYLSYGGMPGLRYLGSRIVPILAQRAGEDVADTVLVTNPARLLSRH